MHGELRPDQVDILVGTPAVNNEFSNKIKELDRRLQVNGLYYRDWETLNDRQQQIFSHDMFLDGECATSAEHYVKGAVNSCGCPDTVEELHHHSPVLMREIEKQQEMLPDMKVKIGEGLDNLNEVIDLLLQEVLEEAPKDEYKPSHGGYSGSTRMQSLDFKDIDWSSVTGASEAAEEYIVWAINNRKRLPVDLDKVTQYENIYTGKGGGNKLALNAVRLGEKIGNAGNISRARKYENPLADPTGGDTKKRQDPRSAAGSDAGLNQTPKTDLLLDKKRVSLKEADKGYQIEAIEEKSFGILFAAALSEYAKREGKSEISSDFQQTAIDILTTVLNRYRKMEPELTGAEAVNNFLGLKGGKKKHSDDLKDLAYKALSTEYLEQVQQTMLELFQDPDFKYEFVKQALTGQYKFEKGNQAIADWVMEINLKGGTFGARKINDEYLRYLAEKVKWNVRTGRAKAAPEASDAAYHRNTELLKGWTDYVAPMLRTLQPILGSSTEQAAAEALGKEGFRWITDDDGNISGINSFYYQFLKYLASYDQKPKGENPRLSQQAYDELWNQFKEKGGVSGSEENSDLMVAGRSGRFALDVKPNKGDLENSFKEGKVFNSSIIAEGIVSDALGLLSKPIKGLVNLAKQGWEKLLKAVGIQASADIEIPPLPQDDTFEE